MCIMYYVYTGPSLGVTLWHCARGPAPLRSPALNTTVPRSAILAQNALVTIWRPDTAHTHQGSLQYAPKPSSWI